MVVERFAVGLALAAMVAGCSSSTPQVPVPPAPPDVGRPSAQADTVALASEPATIRYGSVVYSFSVPARDDHSNIGVTAGAVPGGVLWLTPPGFPDAAAHPISTWSLWFTPASTTGGSLWTGAQQWQTFTKGQAPRMRRFGNQSRGPNAKVTLMDNGCAGCYQPGVTSLQIYDSFSSPLMGAAKGDTYTWLDEQTVAFTLPPDEQNPYPTYGVTRTFAECSGNRQPKVSIAEEDRSTATIILNSMLARP